MSPSSTPERNQNHVQLSASAAAQAIEELKRRGKDEWGASYYSQLAAEELCRKAGRPRAVQYGALISWLKRISEGSREPPVGAIQLVAYLTDVIAEECITTTAMVESPLKSRERIKNSAVRGSQLEVNCPSVIHDHRFVVVGELPDDHLFPAVFVQPIDGTGYFYPQVAHHNPLRAGRAFACFAQIGNPAGIWHVKRPPLDARVRVLALEKPWNADLSDRLLEEDLNQLTCKLGVVAQIDSLTSRVSTDPLTPSLRDSGPHAVRPLIHHEPQPESCVAPFALNWKGGAAYIEVREGDGDRVVFAGTAGPGAVLTIAGRVRSLDPDRLLCELATPGRYRVRLYPAIKSFVDPSYEWWLELR